VRRAVADEAIGGGREVVNPLQCRAGEVFMEERNSDSNGSETGTRQAFAAAGQVIDKLGLVDLAVPALRRQIARIDVDELVESAIDYVKRKPEVLVVLFGTLTITSGLLVFLSKHGEEMVDATRSTARRVVAAVEPDDDDDDEEDGRSASQSSSKRSSKSASGRGSSASSTKSGSKR
jgi:hypothetical protein